MSTIATIAQEMISLYAMWERYDDDGGDGVRSGFYVPACVPTQALRSGTGSCEGTPEEEEEDGMVTPAVLMRVLARMRESRLADLARSTNGRAVAVNKILERAQAVG